MDLTMTRGGYSCVQATVQRRRAPNKGTKYIIWKTRDKCRAKTVRYENVMSFLLRVLTTQRIFVTTIAINADEKLKLNSLFEDIRWKFNKIT